MTALRRIVQFAVLAVAAAVLVWYGFRDAPAPPRDTGPNLLIVIVDTLRPDWLSAYGMDRYRTPHVDALAARGVLFGDVVCQMPATLPSHASIFTSTYPDVHGVKDNATKLSRRATTLAEVLHRNGWRTAAFVSNPVLQTKTRIDQGFSTYDDDLPDLELNRDHPERIGEKTTDAALAWLADHPRGYFLFVHYQDPHGPYNPPAPYRNRVSFDTDVTIPISDLSNPVNAIPNYQALHGSHRAADYLSGYAGEVMYADDQLGRLLDGAKRLGALDDTYVVFTSDHGESLGEQGLYFQHATSLHQAQLAIPLIVAGPGIESGQVEGLVQSVDLMPTLLDLLGVTTGARMQGHSLIAALNGETSNLPRIAYGGLADRNYFRHDRWKFISSGEKSSAELYDLKADPRETANRAEADPAQRERFVKMMSDLQEGHLDLEKLSGERLDDPETLRRLKALGYVQ